MSSVVKKKKKRFRRLKKLLAWVIVLALAAGAVRLFVWPQLVAGATTTYNSYTARIGSISNSLSFSASMAVQNNETLSSEGAATVRQIYVSEGEQVVRGQRLMRLSDGSTLKASFDGEVNLISVDVGDDVGANTSLIQIVDFRNMQVSMRVDEYAISQVQVGQQCQVTITALEQTYDTQIAHINRISSGGGNTAYYTVTAKLEVGADVLPGMQATVTIPQEEAVDSVILNRDALSFGRDNSAYVLMKDENDQMQQVAVTVGVDNDNYVEITSGLKDGDTVYKEQTTKASGGGLFNNLSSIFGGGGTNNRQTNRQQRMNNSGYPGSMPGGFGGR